MHAPQEDDSRYEAYFVLDGTRVCLEEGDELDWKLFRAKVDKVESVHVLLPAWPVLGLFYWGGEGAPARRPRPTAQPRYCSAPREGRARVGAANRYSQWSRICPQPLHSRDTACAG